MFRIAVFASGEGTNLQALIDRAQKDDLGGAQIALVISEKKEALALERARKARIPAFFIKKESQEQMEEEILRLLSQYNIDLIVLAGFNSILSPNFLHSFGKPIINIHPSLLPAFAGLYGLKVHQKVLEYGCRLTGATVHLVTEEVDSGPVILQKATEVKEDDTPQSLSERVKKKCEWEILPQAVRLFAQGKIEIQGRKVRTKNETSSDQRLQ